MRYYAPSLQKNEKKSPYIERFCEAFEKRYSVTEAHHYTVGIYEDGEPYITIAGQEVFKGSDLI